METAQDPTWRAQVTTASLDPFGGYATALRTSLPDAVRMLDAFHVVRLGQYTRRHAPARGAEAAVGLVLLELAVRTASAGGGHTLISILATSLLIGVSSRGWTSSSRRSAPRRVEAAGVANGC